MINVKLLTPEKVLYNSTASKIILSTTTGEIAVLAGHEPLVTTINAGQIIIEDENKSRTLFASYYGLAHIENHKGKTNVIVMLESSEDVKNLDEAKLSDAIARAEVAAKEKDMDLNLDSGFLRDFNSLKILKRNKK